MNNDERRQWIDNDEGLYNWQRSSGLSMTAFIKEHREEIDACIDRAIHRYDKPEGVTKVPEVWDGIGSRPMY